MTPSDKAPLVGWMILEDYCEDMSQWDGVISFPDPTGANLAWQDPIKMIEYEAYAEALQWADRLADTIDYVRGWVEQQPTMAKAKADETHSEFHQWRKNRGR